MAWVPSPAEKLPHTLDMAIKKKKFVFSICPLGTGIRISQAIVSFSQASLPSVLAPGLCLVGKRFFFFFFFNRDLNDFLLKFS